MKTKYILPVFLILIVTLLFFILTGLETSSTDLVEWRSAKLMFNRETFIFGAVFVISLIWFVVMASKGSKRKS